MTYFEYLETNTWFKEEKVLHFNYDIMIEAYHEWYCKKYGTVKHKKVASKFANSSTIGNLVKNAQVNEKAIDWKVIISQLHIIPFFIFSRKETVALGAIFTLEAWDKFVNIDRKLMSEGELKIAFVSILYRVLKNMDFDVVDYQKRNFKIVQSPQLEINLSKSEDKQNDFLEAAKITYNRNDYKSKIDVIDILLEGLTNVRSYNCFIDMNVLLFQCFYELGFYKSAEQVTDRTVSVISRLEGDGLNLADWFACTIMTARKKGDTFTVAKYSKKCLEMRGKFFKK